MIRYEQKLFIGDSRFLKGVKNNSVDLVVGGPPYFNHIVYSRDKGQLSKISNYHQFLRELEKVWKSCKRVLKPNGTIWISGTYHSIFACGFALQVNGYKILNDISWFKPNASPNLSGRYFTASHETLIWARKDPKEKHTFNYKLMREGYWPEDSMKKPGKQMRSVWSINTPKPEEKKFGKHPTQKPLDLLRRIVLASTNKGDIIIDPFTGSSTTGLAAAQNERKFIGIDNENQYLDLSIKRYEDMAMAWIKKS